MAVQFRRATPDDLEALIGLLNLLFSLEADFEPNPAKQRDGLTLMLERAEERCVMIAEESGAVIGMGTAQLLVSTAEGGMVALIEDLVVQSEYRGRGIGKRLLSSIESWALAKGARRLELLADRNNHLALGFYDQLNWRRTQLICLHKK
jgi:ribosomal protein S18 acetylase RimI-like enzyme